MWGQNCLTHVPFFSWVPEEFQKEKEKHASPSGSKKMIAEESFLEKKKNCCVGWSWGCRNLQSNAFSPWWAYQRPGTLIYMLWRRNAKWIKLLVCFNTGTEELLGQRNKRTYKSTILTCRKVNIRGYLLKVLCIPCSIFNTAFKADYIGRWISQWVLQYCFLRNS